MYVIEQPPERGGYGWRWAAAPREIRNQIYEWRNGENCVFRGALECAHVYEVAVFENRPDPFLNKGSCNDFFFLSFLV